MPAEHTLVIIKPEAIQKGLTGSVMTKLTESGCRVVGAKMTRVSQELAEIHYRNIRTKPFFKETVRYLMGDHHSKLVMALVYEGREAIAKIRKITGATNPEEAAPGTIRGMFGRITSSGIFENVIHASSSAKDAAREIKLWFRPDELMVKIYPTKRESVTQTLPTWSSSN